MYSLYLSCVYLVDYGCNSALVNHLVNPLHPICVLIRSYGTVLHHMAVLKLCVGVSPVPRPLSAQLCVACSTYM